jgi:hypothetical protein
MVDFKPVPENGLDYESFTQVAVAHFFNQPSANNLIYVYYTPVHRVENRYEQKRTSRYGR